MDDERFICFISLSNGLCVGSIAYVCCIHPIRFNGVSVFAILHAISIYIYIYIYHAMFFIWHMHDFCMLYTHRVYAAVA